MTRDREINIIRADEKEAGRLLEFGNSNALICCELASVL